MPPRRDDRSLRQNPNPRSSPPRRNLASIGIIEEEEEEEKESEDDEEDKGEPVAPESPQLAPRAPKLSTAKPTDATATAGGRRVNSRERKTRERVINGWEGSVRPKFYLGLVRL